MNWTNWPAARWLKNWLTHNFRASGSLIVTGAVFAIIVVGTIAAARQPDEAPAERQPQLIIGDTVSADFEELAQETWTTFIAVFRARSGCFGDVRLEAARNLNSRAAYDPGSAIVTVRVPATAAMLKSALIHEWAHHIEFQCAAHQDLRPAFLAAQGLPPDTPWRLDNSPTDAPEIAWSNIPSEQYAEAAIELALGRRQIPGKIHLTKEAVQALEMWAYGE